LSKQHDWYSGFLAFWLVCTNYTYVYRVGQLIDLVELVDLVYYEFLIKTFNPTKQTTIQPGNLATWQPGNLVSWQPGNPTWCDPASIPGIQGKHDYQPGRG
jgi:hypothetical protein